MSNHTMMIHGVVIEYTEEDKDAAYELAMEAWEDLPLEQRVTNNYTPWSKGFVHALFITRHLADKGLL